MRFRRLITAAALAAILSLALMTSVLTAGASQLPSNCTKQQGTVVCSTFSGPGNNQAGVGTTTTSRTQGNTTNYSPAPQGTGTTSSCNPPKSQGNPCR